MSAASPGSAGIMRSLLAPITCLLDARQVVYYLTRKSIVLRYRGSALGIVWSFIVPALTLAIYTVVFGVVLRARWSTGESSTTQYALLLYLGLCVYWFVSECVSEAPSLIANHSNYVKKIVFPLDILPWVSVFDALFHSVIRLAVFVIVFSVLWGLPPWTIILLPIVWLPVCLWTLGLCWILAAAGVFLRDLREIISLMLIALLFLSPIFYPIDRLPALARNMVLLNPVALPVMQTRDVAYYGVIPDPLVWLAVATASAVFAWGGHAIFSRSRGAFADVV
ncbi:MAG: ABC transporter permease [Myxococcota bacterium]